MTTIPTSIDQAAERLKAAGYSYGHVATINRDGGERRFMVYAHRGELSIIEHAKTLADAYEAAARKVV